MSFNKNKISVSVSTVAAYAFATYSTQYTLTSSYT